MHLKSFGISSCGLFRGNIIIFVCKIWREHEMSTDVLETHVASIFWVEEYDKEETRVKAGGKRKMSFSGDLVS
jgi:hypothetical protein